MATKVVAAAGHLRATAHLLERYGVLLFVGGAAGLSTSRKGGSTSRRRLPLPHAG